MLLKDKKVIIFDLDGTLIDSAPDLANSLNYMLDKLKRERFTQSKVREWIGNGAEILVKRALLNKKEIEGESVDSELLKKALMIFLDHYKQNNCSQTKLYPDVLDTLRSLSKRYRLTIATNKPDEFVLPIISKLGIDLYIDEFVGSGKFKNKPDPQMINFILQKFDTKSDEAVMIGDSKNDIIAAQNAKVDSILVRYGYDMGEDLMIYNPTVTVESFKSLNEVLS